MKLKIDDKYAAELMTRHMVLSDGVSLDVYRLLQDRATMLAEIARLWKAHTETCRYIEQTLGKALGYPRFCDDQKTFPDSTPDDGVCIFDHTAETLALEAANKLSAHKFDVPSEPYDV